jgi:flagellar biosynthetic protein FliR
VRAVFVALETMAAGASYAIGLNSVFAPVDTEESLPALSTFVVLCATMLTLAANLHLEMIRGIVDSYRVIPAGTAIDPGYELDRLLQALSASFLVGLRIAAAPLAFAFLANSAAGLLNRLAPQIQAYFLATPFIATGGLYLIYKGLPDVLTLFQSHLAERLMKW